MQGEVRSAEGVGAAAECTEGGRLKAKVHLKHAYHIRELGRVKVQRLVEHGCPLPSRKGLRSWARCGPGDRRATGYGGTSSVQGWAELQIWGRAGEECT